MDALAARVASTRSSFAPPQSCRRHLTATLSSAAAPHAPLPSCPRRAGQRRMAHARPARRKLDCQANDGTSPSTSGGGVEADREVAALAALMVEFVAKLPQPTPGSAAETLRRKLSDRCALPTLTTWVADVGAELQLPLSTVGAMLSLQPSLLAMDTQVISARVRGMGELLGLPLQDALAMAQQRPGLLLYDMPTLDSRLQHLMASFQVPREQAVRMAQASPVWLLGGPVDYVRP